ncbi:MAG: hypothetical protein Q7S27_04535 [Nanoarchaeota archaeon]|nr:hypothetical protein [Nanoarchaeota archaeon]
MKNKSKTSNLLKIILAGVLIGCSDSKKPSQYKSIEKFEENDSSPTIKIESNELYTQARVVGRSYSPGFSVNKNVDVYHHSGFETSHGHTIPINISQPERYFLFVKINDRTIVKEVEKELFRDAKDNQFLIARYTLETISTYKPNSPEAEKIKEEFHDIEINSLELPK